MAFPVTTPQVPVYGMVSGADLRRARVGAPTPDENLRPLTPQLHPQMAQMGGVPVMAAQPMMYNQPVLRPTNPFTPMPGAQVSWERPPPPTV